MFQAHSNLSPHSNTPVSLLAIEFAFIRPQHFVPEIRSLLDVFFSVLQSFPFVFNAVGWNFFWHTADITFLLENSIDCMGVCLQRNCLFKPSLNGISTVELAFLSLANDSSPVTCYYFRRATTPWAILYTSSLFFFGNDVKNRTFATFYEIGNFLHRFATVHQFHNQFSLFYTSFFCFLAHFSKFSGKMQLSE